MEIEVVFKDNREGRVDETLLDDMLAKDMISMFRRSDSWAIAGVDNTRGTGGMFLYAGPDRRTMSGNTLNEEAYFQYAA